MTTTSSPTPISFDSHLALADLARILAHPSTIASALVEARKLQKSLQAAPRVLIVPSLEKCDGVQSTFLVERVAAFRDCEGPDVVIASISGADYICHNNCSNHQVNVWAVGVDAIDARQLLVDRLARHPAPVRLIDGGDQRPHAVCQAEWERSLD